ncbi:transposase [Leptolyngbya sp. GGD]|uniref:transposase n=1 Tax=Leptolyngbya sp. GGD TaxID=2997907 RepID=UPI00227ADFC3|nr:transposase [Leptolyngbya sp. GGD]MCY6493413.1 hypothetical protein [Leptolyngbya sp. GGD]
MTILIAFQQQGYRTFKDYYLKYVCCYWRAVFPGLISYQRFLSWMPLVLLPSCAYLRSRFGMCNGNSFIDFTSLRVCHNCRTKQHRVFENLSARGKTSVSTAVYSLLLNWN